MDESGRLRVAVRGWAIGAAVYLLAVFHRTSLGVAGLIAARRFGISPGQLSVFVLLQLGVYAAMQIPTGVLVDRFGPRRILIVAATFMGVAQLLFAVVANFPAALFARALLGCGDAMTFVSVLRFAVTHFSARRYPLVVAVTAMLGQLGNVVATAPLSALLRGVGWAPTFAVAAGLSLAGAAGVWLGLPRADTAPAVSRSLSALRAQLHRTAVLVRTAWRVPATRAGFWVHFSCMSTSLTFAVLWGVPYLVDALGFPTSGASRLLLLNVVVAVLVSPLVGLLVSRRPAARVPVCFGVCTVTLGLWALVLGGFHGHPPTWLVTVHVAVLAVGPPLSMVGFGLARDYNPAGTVGIATGVVNVGGFLAAVLCAVSIGAVLDAAGSTGTNAFRAAFAVAAAVQAVGTVQSVRWWRRARATALRAQQRGEAVPVPVVRRRFDLTGYVD